MKLYTHAPHPLVLRPPASVFNPVTPGTEADVTVLLVGRASHYFPYILLAFQQLSKEGLGADRIPFEVQYVTGGSDQRVVYRPETRTAVRPLSPEIAEASIGAPEEGILVLDFVTPIRLRMQNRILRQPDFGVLVSAALRRLELLANLHDSGNFDIRASEVAALALNARVVRNETHWYDVVRYSRRQGRDMPLGGLVGRAVFAGPILGLSSLLKLSGRVHVGRGTIFGNGYFRVREARRE